MQTFSPPCQRLPFEGTHSTPRSLAVSPRYYPARARLSSWRKQVGRPKAVLAFFHGELPGAGGLDLGFSFLVFGARCSGYQQGERRPGEVLRSSFFCGAWPQAGLR